METVHGVPSFSIDSDRVHANVTLHSGAVGPVVFKDDQRQASPYSLAPWLPGEVEGLDPLLDGLRGDFLCLPFGSPEGVVAHGAAANEDWSLVEQSSDAITMELHAGDIDAHLTKTISVRNGQPAVYQEFTIAGLEGEFPFGTHPIIDLSGQPAGAARISTSAMRWQGVCPGWFSVAERDETQILQPDATFDDLSAIPAIDGDPVDLSHYPTPVPHEDLVMLVNDPAAGAIGWTAVSCPDFVWFSLKDVRALPATLLWVSNGGRRAQPWSGRHVGRLGVEDVCSYFALGLEPSRSNPLRDSGIDTVKAFSAGSATTVRAIQCVALPPAGFGRVADISFTDDLTVTLTDEQGLSVAVSVDWRWVLTAS